MNLPRITAASFALFWAVSLTSAAVDLAPTPKTVRSAGCPEYFYFRPKRVAPALRSKATAPELQTCANLLREEVTAFRDLRRKVKANEQTAESARKAFFGENNEKDSLVVQRPQLSFAVDNSVSLYLFKAHTLYKLLREWERTALKDGTSRANKPTSPDEEEQAARMSISTERAMDNVQSTIHEAMEDEGLRELFSTALDTGVSWADSGNSVVPPARDSGETQARGIVAWESKHFGEEHSWSDFSLSGSFGYAPSLLLVRVKSSAAGSQPSAPQAIYQQAFVWALTPRWNVRVGGMGEVSLFGRAGQARLTGDTESFKRGEQSFVAERINNNTGRAEHFLETGFEYRLFERPTEIVHHEKSFLLPAFFVAAGYRKDNRFRTGGDGFGDLHVTPHRVFYRVGISLNRILNLRKDIVKSEKFSFRFVVDHERSDRANQVPHGTRFFFGGDLDLLKVIKGN